MFYSLFCLIFLNSTAFKVKWLILKSIAILLRVFLIVYSEKNVYNHCNPPFREVKYIYKTKKKNHLKKHFKNGIKTRL